MFYNSKQSFENECLILRYLMPFMSRYIVKAGMFMSVAEPYVISGLEVKANSVAVENVIS